MQLRKTRGIYLNVLNLTLMASCDGVLGLGDAILTGGGGSGWEWGALTAAAASPPLPDNRLRENPKIHSTLLRWKALGIVSNLVILTQTGRYF